MDVLNNKARLTKALDLVGVGLGPFVGKHSA